MRRAPADALRALAEMPIAGYPPRLPTHPGRFLAVLRPPSRSALTSNPHSARCPAGAQLSATSCLGAFQTPVARACGGLVIAGVRKPAQEETLVGAPSPRDQCAVRCMLCSR